MSGQLQAPAVLLPTPTAYGLSERHSCYERGGKQNMSTPAGNRTSVMELPSSYKKRVSQCVCTDN
jgi:hypothetical protein